MNSKTVLLSGVVLLLVGTLAGYLYGVDSTPAKTTVSTTTMTATVSTVPDAYGQVANTYANQLLQLDARNTSALTSGYESNATVDWKGYANGLQEGGSFTNRALRGNYTGSQEISTLLGAFLTNAEDFLVTNETQTIGPEGNYWVVNSTFDFAGNSSTIGTFEGAIVAQESYVHVGNTWLIANEMWNFISYDSQFIDG
jgi:hypothetical protein